ncbi:MAG: sulfotransferase [Gammaproteobacteria bacterium]
MVGGDDRREAVRAALASDPDNAGLLMELGRLEYEAWRPGEAEQSFRKLVELDPSAESLEWLGASLNRQERFREALPMLRRALDLQPDRSSAWNSAGEALGNLGQLQEAANAFAQAVRWQPEFAQAHYNMGLALRAMNRDEAAAVALRRSVELAPDFSPAVQALGNLLHAHGRYQDAVRWFRGLVRLEPDSAAAHTSLGAAYQMLGNLELARDCYLRAVELRPDYPDAHNNLGTAWQGLREAEKSEASFRRALELNPEHLDALAGLAANFDRRGRYEEGLDLLENHLEPTSGNPELLTTAAQLLRHLERSEESIALLENALLRQDLTNAARQRLHFNLADGLDDLGRFDSAFEHYSKGNAAKPVQFNRAEYLADVDRLVKVFSPERFADLIRVNSPDERPVFVVGMPRSGTSLVEQILSCHKQVTGAGELTDLGRLAIGLGGTGGPRFPDSVTTVSENTLRAAATDYLECLNKIDPDAKRIIDKTPANHLFLGLVEMLFPKAHIIHCVRHPLDTALSCYFQNFAGQGIPFSYALSDIALYFNQYLRVMEHWRRNSGLRIQDVVYEELVADQESISRGLVDFLGLDWDPECLQFHESDRLVATASHAQVRRPLYSSSSGRYRNYENHIADLRNEIDWAAWQKTGLATRVEACI